MKTVPNYPRHPNDRNTSALIRSLIVAAIMLAILLFFTGCQLTVTAQPDYEGWIEYFQTGDIPRAIITPAK